MAGARGIARSQFHLPVDMSSYDHTPRKLVIIIPALLGLIWATVLLSGCRTMEGAGKDLENAGESIQKSAK
jgi:predicted small secreted protein